MRLVHYELPLILTVAVAWLLGRWLGRYVLMPLGSHPILQLVVLLIGIVIIGSALRYRLSFRSSSGDAAKR